MKKGNRTILGALAIAALLAAFAWIARPVGTSGENNSAAGRQSSGTAELSAEEVSYDFGTISMAAGKVKHQFKIKNSKSESVTIKKIYTSCMCTSAELDIAGQRQGPFGMPGHGVIPTINKEIKGGEEGTVEVTFDPAAHGPAGVGRIVRQITVETATGGPLQIGIAAEVTP